MLPHHYELIAGTDQILSTIIRQISGAENYIFLQFMTFENDAIGKQVIKALLDRKAVKPDLTVYLMVDHYIDLWISDRALYKPHFPATVFNLFRENYSTHKALAGLKSSGIKVRMTNKPSLFNLKSFWQRDHRKIVLIDDKLLLGGYNISEHNHSWHDTFMLIDNKELVTLVKQIYQDKFAKDYTAETPIKGSNFEIYQHNSQILAHLRDICLTARKHIFIESAYLEDDELLEILASKHKQGLQVKVLLPEQNNRKRYAAVNHKYLSLYPEFIFIASLPKAMTHAKIALIDGTGVYGSSCFNHEDVTEICLFINDTGIAGQFLEYFKTPRN